MLDTAMKQTALADRHRALGARMVPFAGWLMPLQYTGVLDEHRAVRETCGIFDVSHMGAVFVRGPASADFLQRTLTNDVVKAPPGRAQYTMLLNDAGGVVDDLIILHVDDDEWLVVPNAGNVETVTATLQRLSDSCVDVVIADSSDCWGILALQGPRFATVLHEILPSVTVDRFFVRCFSSPHGDGILAGTGYTGSPGVEVFAPNETIVALWDAAQVPLVAVGGKPAGLAARDVLRLEMGFLLHGSDISSTITPLEAGLDWVVVLDKGPFVGAESLRRQRESGVTRKLIGLVTADRRPLRAHCRVLSSDGSDIGEVTSGGFSPLLGVGIALALVAADLDPAAVDVRGSAVPIKVVDPPFVRL